MSLPKTTTTTAASNYAAVKKKIERDRLAPWSSAPAMKIGNFVVNPLSLRSMTDLELAGNAFFTGSEIIEGDIAAYIWRHHPDYGDDSKESTFLKEIGSVTDTSGLIGDIVAHQLAAFAETPQCESFGGTKSDNRLPAIPAIASLCHEYGAAYGVDPRAVADIDLRIVFQCCRAIRMSRGEVKYLEPKKLRAAKSELLKSNG